MKKIIKYAFLMMLMIGTLFMTACDSSKISGFTLKTSEIYFNESPELSSIKIDVNYKDGTVKEISLIDAMISSSDIEKLKTEGKHTITITYDGYSSELEINIIKKTLADLFEIRFNGAIIEARKENGNWNYLTTLSQVASFIDENNEISSLEVIEHELVVSFSDDTTLTVEIPTITEYIITLDANGGTLDVDIFYALDGDNVTLPIPTREDCIFQGWFTENGLEITSDYPIIEDLHLTARWTRAADISSVLSSIDEKINSNNAFPVRSGIQYLYEDESYKPYDFENNCFFTSPKLEYDPVVVIVDNFLTQVKITINFGISDSKETVINKDLSYNDWSGYVIHNGSNNYFLPIANALYIKNENVINGHLDERVFDISLSSKDALYGNQTENSVVLELNQVIYNENSYTAVLFNSDGTIKNIYKGVSSITSITLEPNSYLYCPSDLTPSEFQNLTTATLEKKQQEVDTIESEATKLQKIKDTVDSLERLYNGVIFEEAINLTMSGAAFGTTIEWKSNNTSIIQNDGTLGDFYGTRRVTFNVTVSYKGVDDMIIMTLNAKGKPYKDISENVVAGYVYYGTGYNLTDELLDTLDIIYFAFANVNSDHEVYLSIPASSALRSVINKAHDKGVRVVLSIGENSNLFSDAAASLEARKKFASSIANMLVEWELDGIDIDWELPGLNTDRPLSVDMPNYTLLIAEIYNAIKKVNPEYLLTAAVPGGAYGYRRFELNKLVRYFDFLNLMTYDMQGNTSGCHHSALYPSAYTTTSASISESVEIYRSNGFPLNKLIIGAAFYGRYKMKSGEGVGANIRYTNIKAEYLNKIGTDSTIKRMWDDIAKAPYITVNGVFEITYDDPESIKEKCKYVASTGVRGIMFWDYGSDSTGDLVHALNESLDVMKK